MTSNPLASRLTRMMFLGNLAGALLTFMYYNFLDPSAHEGAPSFGFSVAAFFVVSFAALAVVTRAIGVRWSRPVIETRGALPEGLRGDELRRRALLVPQFFALLSFMAWVIASLLWGVGWPRARRPRYSRTPT